jgi:hypothetical protein
MRNGASRGTNLPLTIATPFLAQTGMQSSTAFAGEYPYKVPDRSCSLGPPGARCANGVYEIGR